MPTANVNPQMYTVCLAILNYNGQHHLENLLPTAVAEASRFGPNCSVVVIDNRSSKDDVAWVQSNFPSVNVWLAPSNDFLFSYNTFAKESPADIVIFLNNDLKLLEGFISPLVRHFRQNDVFSVSATSRDWDDTEYTFGPVRLESHRGMYYWLPDIENQKPGATLFTSGGFMAVDRRKFLELGGFNRMFFPAYGEDLELCVRAWRKGWRCLFEPASVALHRESASWGHEVGSRGDRLRVRASLLFQWSCLPDAAPRLERALYWILLSLRKLRRGQGWWLHSALKARWEWRSLRGQYCVSPMTPVELARITGHLGHSEH